MKRSWVEEAAEDVEQLKQQLDTATKRLKYYTELDQCLSLAKKLNRSLFHSGSKWLFSDSNTVTQRRLNADFEPRMD